MVKDDLVTLNREDIVFVLLTKLTAKLFNVYFFGSVRRNCAFRIATVIGYDCVVALTTKFFLFRGAPSAFSCVTVTLVVTKAIVLGLSKANVLFTLLTTIYTSTTCVLISLNKVRPSGNFVTF